MGLDELDLRTLSDLKRKRGAVKASLTRIRTFLNRFNIKEEAITLLEFRQEELPKISARFDEVQCQIELIDVDNVEEAEIERGNFEMEYYAIRSEMQESINAGRIHNTSAHNSSFSTTNQNQRTQLPPVPLPTFGGNIQDWFSFFDIFKAMVHDVDSYSSAQKFFYLRSCLRGPALDLVQSIPVSDVNYDVVIRRLTQRYENNSLVIQSHIRSILDCPIVEESKPGSLQKLYSTVCTNIAALKALKQPVEHWDAWLITIIARRLDKNTANGWQLHQKNTDLPKYEELDKFLASRCIVLENSEVPCLSTGNSYDKLEKMGNMVNSKKGSANTLKRSLVAAISKSARTCVCCSEYHRLYECRKFKELSVTDRLGLVRDKGLCFNCLSPFHTADICKSKYSCKECGRKHNFLLHFEKSIELQPNDIMTEEIVSPSTSKSLMSLPVNRVGSHVFLTTAVVIIKDYLGDNRECRAILDCGSQNNFISRKLARLLRLKTSKTLMSINGIGANQAQSTASVEINMSSNVKGFSVNITCHILPVIVNELPSVQSPREGWNIPNDLTPYLADPRFSESGPIDLLIGGGIFYELLEAKRIYLGAGTFSLQDSKLGWLVTGEMNTTCLVGMGSIGESLAVDWRALQENEDLCFGRNSKVNKKCKEEKETLEYFNQTTIRDKDGRFVVCLPRKLTVDELGSTLAMATSRFLSLERRLQSDRIKREEYIKFINEYIELGHMEEVIHEDTIPTPSYYLPHHAVMKSSSLTTKLRVVFDASAKSSTGLSLNDVLKCGPVVQEDVFGILTRFRKHQYVITSDVEKMFRQVMVTKKDWDLQRILWRSNPNELLRTYQLKTVTYGTAPASFLATQCLVMLAEEMHKKYPEAANSISHDFYIDDLMTGADTEERCSVLQKDIDTILCSAMLPLRKWCSNSQVILNSLNNPQNDPLYTLKIGDEDSVKSLGLEWRPIADKFNFTIITKSRNNKLTKRIILSDLNRIFDPLGFLAPVLIRGKIFLQQLWATKLDWDSKLSQEIENKWINFYNSLEQLKYCAIPRKVIPSIADEIEMHGFCDASEQAYGACIYVRSKDQDGNWHARLLCAKNRVAPLKGSTIPRLELNGALLLASLAHKVSESWSVSLRNFKLWTDSTVVLGWLNAQTTRLKTYVLNRVNQILELTQIGQWHHVRTDENPADVVSRGISGSMLLESQLWWHGPSWLCEKQGKSVPSSAFIENENLPEQRKIKLALVVSSQHIDIIDTNSDWHQLVRKTAWLSLFIDYLRNKKHIETPDYLTVTHLKKAEMIILRRVQAECFPKEIAALKGGKEVARDSKLKSLYPYIANGILLVGGRLQNANLRSNQKHPIILPAKHRLTRLIFESCHREMLHCGPQALLARVRQYYWPLLGRMTARTTVRKCFKCVRASPRFYAPLMGQLPKDRVQMSRPFSISGVDFTGPFIVRSGIRRIVGKKVWIAVFICFSTRAVHLELVEDMTSDAFLACLKRFISRRGRCSVMYSDNGTNFVGAQREMAAIIKKGGPMMAKEGIEWRFNPPAGPHFGGLWEAAVKSTKFHLKRVMGETKLTLAELNTLLCQIEACLNSRPITSLSSEPGEPEALTPAHFLIGGPLSLPPEPDRLVEAPCSLRRWKYVQFLVQSFWQRWYTEYLPQCQVRGKWFYKKRPLKIDDVVIIKEDNLPPTKWKLGRITQVHAGKDGIIRVVTLRTSSGTEIKRPTIKLCLLPTDNDITPVENVHFQRGEDVAA